MLLRAPPPAALAPTSRRLRQPCRLSSPTCAGADAAETATAAAQTSEAAGYKKRAEESAAAGIALTSRPPAGGDAPPPGDWCVQLCGADCGPACSPDGRSLVALFPAAFSLRLSQRAWTLNWDFVHAGAQPATPDDAPPPLLLLLGSCPKTGADVRRIAAESPATAILCLQSDDCLAALGVDLDAVRAAAAETGLLWTRCAVRDFDRLDQAAMLPDLVRALNALLALGRVPYVHCTAGINRAPLAVVGLLTFARGWELDAAVAHVRSERPQANPYILPWTLARERMLHGREEELYLRAAKAGESSGDGGDWVARDWKGAQAALLQEGFARNAEVDCALYAAAERLARAAAV